MKTLSKPETISRHRRLFDCRVTILLLALLAGPGAASAQGASATLRKTFNNPTPAAFDLFGSSVAALGPDRVLVGAEGAGEAYLFDLTGKLLSTFTNPTPSGDSFGATVAAVGNDRVLVGAYNFTASYQGQPRQIGRAYLFATNGTLVTTFTNPHPATVQAFGFGVVATLGGDHVLIASAGSLFLLQTNGALVTSFTNPVPAEFNGFGLGTSAFGNDRVLIGAPYANSGATAAGAAYLFGTNGALLRTFVNPAPVADDNFGAATAAVGSDRVLIGAIDYGAVRGGGTAYLFNTNGTRLATFINPNPGDYDYFGSAVSAVGRDRVLIGAHQRDTDAFQAGAAYLFGIDGTLLATITNPAPATQDWFAYSVAAVGNDHVLIGSVWKDTGATDAGAVYLFALSEPSLSISRNPAIVSISWPASETPFVLQQAGAPGEASEWSNTSNPVSVNGEANVVQQAWENTNRFFRLRRP